MAISEGICDEDRVHETLRLVDQGQGEKALECVNQVLKENPTHIPALHAKACVLIGTKKSQEVLEICAKIQELINPSTYTGEKYSIPRGYVYMSEAIAHLQMENNKQAMDSIQTAIKINTIAPFVLVRCVVHVQAFNFEEALIDATFALKNPYQNNFFGADEGEIETAAREIHDGVIEILQDLNYSRKGIEEFLNNGD